MRQAWIRRIFRGSAVLDDRPLQDRASEIGKKHRVAVLRALHTLVKRGEVPWRFIPKYEKADAEWFNPNRVGIPTQRDTMSQRLNDNDCWFTTHRRYLIVYSCVKKKPRPSGPGLQNVRRSGTLGAGEPPDVLLGLAF
jgi:hypothetical protein